jgi:hypothetical protein
MPLALQQLSLWSMNHHTSAVIFDSGWLIGLSGPASAYDAPEFTAPGRDAALDTPGVPR